MIFFLIGWPAFQQVKIKVCATGKKAAFFTEKVSIFIHLFGKNDSIKVRDLMGETW